VVTGGVIGGVTGGVTGVVGVSGTLATIPEPQPARNTMPHRAAMTKGENARGVDFMGEVL
jgi:hypothetical protein